MGLQVGRKIRKKQKNYFLHPSDSSRVYVVADPCHLLKNIKSGWQKNVWIQLPEQVVKEYNLPTANVCSEDIKHLFDFQKDLEIKYAPKLTEKVINPTHFQKMNVGSAMNFFSTDVAAGLRKLVQDHGGNKNYLSTAWFVEWISKWFTLMASRKGNLA